MKTIIARFTELKENVAGTADSEFDDLDYNKVDTALKSVGVSIKDASGQFRDLDDVFLELSQKWNTLDRNSQRYIATIAAGSRQQSRFIAMMENYDRTIELVDTAYDSAGKSSEQFAKYQDTMEYKLNQLQNTWEQFRTRFFNSSFFKSILDGLNAILGKISDFSALDIAKLAGVWILFGKSMIINFVKGVQDSANLLTKAFTSVMEKVKNPINNILKNKLNFKVGANITELNDKINEVEQKYKEAERKIEENDIVIDVDTKNALQKLDQLETEYERLRSEALGAGFTDEEATDWARSNMSEDDLQNLQRGRTARNALQQRDAGQQELEAQREALDRLREQQESAQKEAEVTGQAIGQVLGAAITIGVSTAITSDNPMDAVWTVIKTMIPMMITSIISMVTAGGAAISAAAIASTAGIMAIVMAITAAITGFVAWIRSNNAEKEANKLTTQIDNLNKKIEETEEKIQKTKTSLSELSKAGDSLEDIKEKWEKLGAKQTLTTEEQEEYNSLIEEIKSEYPELITYYDEENNKMQISLGILNEKIEKQNELIKAEQEILNLQQQQLNTQTYDRDRKQVYKDLTQDNRLFSSYSADLEESFFESAYKGLQGKFQTTGQYDYNYQSGKGVVENYFENKFLEDESDDYLSGKAAEIADSYMQVADIANQKNMSVQEVLKLDKNTLDQYLAESGYGVQAYDENGELKTYTDEQSESIQENIAALTEFNEQVLSTTETFNQLDQANFERQASLNAEIISQELGVEANSAAANILGAQAATITNEMGKINLTGNDNGVASGLDDLKKAMGEYSSGLELSVDQFKDLSEGVTQGHYAGANWSNITASERDQLKMLGIDADIWKNEYQDLSDKEISEKLAKTYSDYAKNAVAEMVAQGQDLKAEELNEAFSELYTEIPEMTVEELNKKKEEFKQKYGEALSAEEWDSTWSTLTNNDILSSAIENLKASGLEEKIINSLSSSSVQYFSGMLDNLSLTELGKNDLTNVIEKVSTNYDLTNKQLETLMSIDLSQGYHEIQRNSETYIDALMDSGMSLEEATNAFNEYISNIGSILGNAILGESGANVVKDMLQEDIKGFKEQYNALIEARNEMIDNEGTISSDTYFSLIEAGFEDYVEVTTNGYELITEKAEEAWTAQAMAPLKELREDIALNKQLLNEAQEISKTDWTINEWNGNSNMSTYTVDDAIERYIENEKKFEGATNQLTDAQKRYIETIVAAGYTTEEEYIKALQEGTATMEKMEPDTWIQGLVNLQEASVDAEEKVNDLKDELKDLNKQLADDQKAVDEAYKAWQEAIHGTEDYQSSLDGLLNYERRLESFNNKLEDTKEALSDVSNINDAKNLLEQTTSLYEGKLGTLKAESKVINQSLENLDKEIMANYANFVSLDKFGNMNVDITALESADMSDILKDDGFTQLLEKRNEMYDKARETDQEYLDTVKEWEEQYKTARESEIKMEETIINILKEKMQEEVDTVKEKYSALEEADNNYLDALQEAIDKQRKLREQENQYEDLATKQKKLSLMQRDTSGANQKEVQQLEKEIEDDQQNLLDSEVDNLIESMQELYEKQKEARDLEIEAMEAETENMQAINETAMTIMAGFQSVEDYQAWLLENDKTVEDMTTTQTEQYLEDAKETFSGYAQYVALTAEDMQLRADEINKQADLVFENTNENVSNIGTTIQELAVAAADKAEEEAKEAYDDAVEKMNETQKKIDETTEKLKKAEDDAVSKHSASMNAMVEASQSSIEKVATFAAKAMIEGSGEDFSNPDNIFKFAQEHNFVNENGEYSQGFINALNDMGYDTSNMMVKQAWEISKTVDGRTVGTEGQYRSKSEALKAIQSLDYGENVELSATPIWTSRQMGAFKEEEKKENTKNHGIIWPDGKKQYTSSTEEAQQIIARILKSTPSNAADGQYKSWATKGDYEIFKTGGLVNYTGPAWVDGTPTKPEAFLNAQDTQRIGEAAKILAQIPALNGASENVSTNIGDTTIEIHINVESIESDYDVDQMIERVKNDILDVSKPTGTSVILKK